MSQAFYITTPIYYVNAEPHLGHAYSTIVADVATRFQRLLGRDARLQTGTDEHGDKIAQAAAKEGVTPKQYADRISGLFRAAWPPLHIAPDNFIRTTDPGHITAVQAILQNIYDAGDIYLGSYGGNYCVGCERFLTDKELIDGKCPDHDAPTQYIEEENYFFRMEKYREELVRHINANPDFIRPERYKNEVLAMLAEDIGDLCISRPKTRLDWGIELPFDRRFVTYVWFDALINYMSGLGWPAAPEFERFWPAAQHLIAKDILKPHGIYWPTMLMALGSAEGKGIGHYLYRRLNVHGYWKVGASKMSKSLGNVVRPLELAQVYGAEAFRYFLMREMAFGLDAAFSEEALVARYNSDLANDLGNLFSRVMNMLHQYRGGVVPAIPPGFDQEPTEVETPPSGVYSTAAHAHCVAWESATMYENEMEGFSFHVGLASVWDLISAANKYVVRREPWTLAKDAAKTQELDGVLHRLCQVLAAVTVMVQPVMPETASKMAEHLGLDLTAPGLLEKIKGSIALLPAGARTSKPPALFPRIDTAAAQAKAAKAEAKAAAKPAAVEPKKKDKPAGKAPMEPPAEIAYEEFARVDLRLGRVLAAERVEGADRLLKLTVDLVEESGPRTVVAGIALHYPPEELVGRQVVVVANLKPAKLKGVESRGMVLAAVGADQVRLVSPDRELPPGSKVR